MAHSESQSAVDTAKAAYVAAEQRLGATLAGLYVTSRDSLSLLIGVADEYGAEHARQQVQADPEQFGALLRDAQVADKVDDLGIELEALLEARDRLDLANAQREAIARRDDPDRLPVVMFGGQEHVIDSARQEIRSVGEPSQRYLFVLPADRGVDGAENSNLTGLRDADGKLPKAVPTQDRSGRGRS